MPTLLSRLRDRQPEPPPELSIVVVSYNMRREVPRTLRSLSIPYQRNIARSEYEIILVDNGSDEPWTQRDFGDLDADLRIVNLRNAAGSPAPAVNRGLREARGKLIGVLIDGARMVTPGLLDTSRRAARLYPRPVVATLGFHLGSDIQAVSISKGYSPEVEDRLLESTDWPEDGYRLFDISVLNASSAWGWFHPITESNALFMPASLWNELGGYAEEFRLPGGGLTNLDVYERALALSGTQLIVLLGEGNFHQVHGGVSSNSPQSRWDLWHEEYQRIRGRAYTVPKPRTVYFGPVEGASLGHLHHSIQIARQRTGHPAPASVELRSEARPLEVQLFWSRSRDMNFCEADSCTVRTPASEVRRTVSLELPAGLSPSVQFRLDLSNQPGLARIFGMQLVGGDGHTIWNWDGRAATLASALRHDLEILASSDCEGVVAHLQSDDPTLILPIPESELSPVVSGGVFKVDFSWMGTLYAG
jgi:hypothetical protein